jgi:predicted Zn-dependent protease
LVAAITAIAACVALLFFFLPNDTIKQQKELLAELERHLNPQFVERAMGEAQTDSSAWQGLLQAYFDGKYKELDQRLGNFTPSSEYYSKAKLLQGIIQLRAKKTTEAILSLQEAAKDPSLEEETDWYLGLAYLYQSKKNKGRQYLEKVIERDKTHAVEAASILDKLAD